MNSTFATRTRPFTDPHPTINLKQDALAKRARMLDERTTAIKSLVDNAEPSNRDIQFWTMVYDFEHAPKTTSRAQLLEHGIVPVPPQELVSDSDLHDELWTVIEALSRSGIYLVNTSHLNDRDLYARLYYRILDEPTYFMPPSEDAAEFIECLHPLDLDHPIGMKAAENRITECNLKRRSDTPYLRGPSYVSRGVLNDRDSHLPKPDWT